MRLIDADELLKEVVGMTDGWFKPPKGIRSIEDLIRNAPTVNLNSYKPCPWCGGHASMHADSLEKENGRGYKGKFEYYIQCNVCGAKAPNGLSYDIYIASDEAKYEAIKAWNKRYGE